MSFVNSFQHHVHLSEWTTNSAFTVTLLFYIHPQYTYQPPEMNVLILSVHYEVHPIVLSMNYISIIATSPSHIRGYSILSMEIRMSTRWSTESIVDGLVQNPSCPSFFDHPKTLNSQEFSQNNEYRVICFVCFQMEIASGSTAPTFALPCQASADSILDYKQYVMLSTGNFLCSAPMVNSTMDFSVKPIEEGVVDSPPNSKLRLPISCSPSPLRSMDSHASSMSPNSSDKGTQRKLYGEETIPIATTLRMPKAKQTALPLSIAAPVVAPIRRRVLSLQ